MKNTDAGLIAGAFKAYIGSKQFACIAAKAALSKNNIRCLVAGNMACPAEDASILAFLYNFIEGYRKAPNTYHSAAVIFREPICDSESLFESLLWQRLQGLSNLDALHYTYDNRVDADPSSAHFSYSLMQEALFIIGMHPASSRPLRKFKYPVLVFNPHEQFEQLRQSGKYSKMQEAVRKRDMAISGSVNPMLADFGDNSEARQYSGRHHLKDWQCPLKINHTTGFL